MKSRVRVLAALALILVMTLVLTVSAGAEEHGGIIASGECGENLTWTLYGDGLLSIDGTGAMWSYSWKEISSTYISTYITTAPWGNYSSSLKALHIGEGVTSIGEYAFRGCSGFTGELVISDSVTTIEGSAFSGCSGFTGDLVIPDSVTTIGEYAFSGCSGFMGDLIIPESVKTIEHRAFDGCWDIVFVYFYGDAPDVGHFIFGGRSATFVIYYPEGASGWTNPWNEYPTKTFDPLSSVIDSGPCGDNLTWTLYKDGLLEISGSGEMWDFGAPWTFWDTRFGLGYDETIPLAPWMYYKSKLKTLILNEGISAIGDNAFFECSGFEGTLRIPGSVTEIGNHAFYNCNGFTGILTIPDSVTTIGKYAFIWCSGFGSLRIGKNVAAIGEGAFAVCKSSTEFRVAEGNPNYTAYNGVLYNADGTTLVACPAGKTEMPPFHPSCMTIGYFAFAACELTGGFVIPDSVVVIDESAFESCWNINSLTIGNNVKTIGRNAFSDCSGLTGSLTIPGSVATIGEVAFACCYGITEFSVDAENPNFIAYNGVIYNADGTTLVACPAGKTEMPSFHPDCTAIGIGAFYGCSNITGNLTIPDSVTEIGDGAFFDCSGLTGTLTIPDSVTTIGRTAFLFCRGFTGCLTIGNGVTEIGNNAFSDCTGITSVRFYGSAPKAGEAIFGYRYHDIDDFVIYYQEGAAGWTNPWNYYSTEVFDPGSVVLASGECGDDLTWTLYEDGLLEISGTGPMWDYGHIFEEQNGETVVVGFVIPPWEGNEVKTLRLNEGITTIGKQVFGWNPLLTTCHLTGDLMIPDSVTTIGDYAFSGCSGFTGTLTIPDSVETIGDSAFSGCTGFTDVFFEGDAPETVGESIFGTRSETFIVRCTAEHAESFTASPNYDASAGTWYGYKLEVIADTPEIIPGDMDGDGTPATPRDAMVLARYIAGWDGYADQINLDAADLDGDSIPATPRDAMVLARHIAGWDGYKTIPLK